MDQTVPNRRQFLTTGTACAALAAASLAVADETAEARGARGLDGIKAILSGKQAATWVITGDSITHGALHTLGWRSYPEHFAERVRWELRRMRDVVINTGISGDRTGGLLGDLDWRVLRFKPDVASVMLGMNDCGAGNAGHETFRANYNAIIDKLLAAGAIPLLHTPNTIYLKNAASRSDLVAYSDIVRDIATQRKLALVDHYKHWEAAKPNQEDLLVWLEDRSIHPGNYGHREFAKLMFKTLGIFDENSPTCMLPGGPE